MPVPLQALGLVLVLLLPMLGWSALLCWYFINGRWLK